MIWGDKVIAAFQNFASIGHPLFTNIVWPMDAKF